MQIYSLIFIFAFLPISVALYYAVPKNFKTALLIVISLLFYAAADGAYVLVLLANTLIDYTAASALNRLKPGGRGAKAVLAAALIKNLVLIFVWRGLGGVLLPEAPFGLLVSSVSATGYLIDVYSGKQTYERVPARFLLYCLFYPKLYAGPLSSYDGFIMQAKKVSFSLSSTATGASEFIQGLAKRNLLALPLMAMNRELKLLQLAGEISALSSWAIVATEALGLYYLLSGFCSMAEGTARMYGISLPRNFYYPFQADSIGSFFNRFNITIHRFISRYIYTSLGGRKNGVFSDCLNILLVSMVMGLWYGMQFNYMVWGIYLAVFMILERYVYGKYLENHPVLSRSITFAIVLISFSVFAGNGTVAILGRTASMFGISGAPAADDNTLYILSSNWAVLILSVVFSSSAVQYVMQNVLKRFPTGGACIYTVIHIMLLAVCVQSIIF